MAGEPSNPLVARRIDPVDRNWLMFSIRVPWVRERARRMQEAATRLLELQSEEAIRRTRFLTPAVAAAELGANTGGTFRLGSISG